MKSDHSPLFIFLVLIISVTPSPVSAQVPVINAFAPVSGAIGSTVTITGSNFGATPSDNLVYFGQVRGVVTTASSSSLSVTVPVGAACAPISVTANHLTAFSNLSFHTTFESNDSLVRSSFVTGINVVTGSSTMDVTAGDFDGDGKPDLVSANPYDYTISVVGNSSTPGNFSFTPKLDLTVGHQATNVTVADLDGDGMLDLAVTSSDLNAVSVFRNSSTPGTIAFNAKADFATGAGPDKILASDLDGDGKTDLIVLDLHVDSMTVLRSTGTPGTTGFAPEQNIVTGANANSIAIGDLNNDGKPDLIVCMGTVVSIYPNISTAGTITFSATQNIQIGADIRNIRLADLDGDGKLDLCGTGDQVDSVFVFRNTSTGGNISFGNPQSFETDPAPHGLSVADFDGDGILDLATFSEIWNSVSVLKGIGSLGNITFQQEVSLSASFAPPGMGISDLDGDGRPDIAITSLFNGNILILRNMVPIPSPGFHLSRQPLLLKSVAVGDTTSDTVSVSNTGSITLSITNVISSDTEFVVTPTSAVIPHGSAQTFTIRYTPVPGGKYNDTVAFIYNSPYSPARLLVNVNVMPPNPPTILSFSPHNGPVGSLITITGTNFDPDPAKDVVYFGPVRGAVISASLTSLAVRVPAGEGYKPVSVTTRGLTAWTESPFGVTFVSTNSFDTLSFAPRADFPTNELPACLASADFDGDGKPDIVTGWDNPGLNFEVFQNVSSGNAPSFNLVLSTETDPAPTRIATADMDGDGNPDLIISGTFDGISILINRSTFGHISFKLPIRIPISYSGEIAVRDIDMDGRPDLVVLKNGGTDSVAILMNISAGGIFAFAPEVDYATDHLSSRIALGDFDGDGKPDIAVSHLTGYVRVYQNTSTPGSISFNQIDPLFAGIYTVDLTVGDFDGDGKGDIAVTNAGNILPSSQSIVVFRNTSAGPSISFSPTPPIRAGVQPMFISAADLDGDGLPDLTLINDTLSAISVLKNNSTPGKLSFAAPVTFVTGRYPQMMLLEDVNGDGRPDMLSPNYFGESISVLTNAIPALTAHYQNSWNLVSAPLTESDYRRTVLFPGCISQVFSYKGAYLASDTLVPGTGYWLRFNGDHDISMSGTGILTDTIGVTEGWNLIGGISLPLPVESITSIPGGLVTSQFFGYQGGYRTMDTIKPGYGYWVKVSGAGELILASTDQSSVTNNSPAASGRIRIIPTEEQPPLPPTGTGQLPVPKEFSLGQNYPNPFNPSTTISYELPKKSLVTLKIFDILGREIETLVEGVEEPGYKSVRFNASGLASGIYFYRLEAGSFTETKKLLLLR